MDEWCRPSIDHGLLSPSGRMSKRARAAANARMARELFPNGLPRPKCALTAAARRAVLLQKAADFRHYAACGMHPRKYAKEAARLEAEAASLETEA